MDLQQAEQASRGLSYTDTELSLEQLMHQLGAERYQARAAEGESIIVMGDFNAGCRYLNDDELAHAELFNEPSLSSLIGDDVDTTTTATFCPYDRLLVSGDVSDTVTESGVYTFDQDLGLTGDQTRAVSDHYPVWARFQLGAE